MTSTSSLDFTIPASTEALEEAEALSAEILQDIELSEGQLSVVVLKALRLARILNDFDMYQILEWESGGYPSGEFGVSQEAWKVGKAAGRVYYKNGSDSEARKEVMYMESIAWMESTIDVGTISLSAAQEMPRRERRQIRERILWTSNRLASRRTFIHRYVARKHYEQKFAGLAEDVFARIRSSVDASISAEMPNSLQQLTAVYDNLRSDNPENWANAVHSCRRVLQALADAVFPAQSEPRTRVVNGKEKPIGLGQDQYINRLMAFIEDSSDSGTFKEIVGSHLRFIGDRLDSIFTLAQKGSHSIVKREEADRCVVYTYMVVGDILSLREDQAR